MSLQRRMFCAFGAPDEPLGAGNPDPVPFFIPSDYSVPGTVAEPVSSFSIF